VEGRAFSDINITLSGFVFKKKYFEDIQKVFLFIL